MTKQWLDTVPAIQITSKAHHVCILKDKAIAIFLIDNDFYAIEDSCPHQALPISEGPIDGSEIECPFHGARFCLKSGEVTAPPACSNLTTFQTRVQEGLLQVLI